MTPPAASPRPLPPMPSTLLLQHAQVDEAAPMAPKP